ncbi:MAG: cytochrome c biogenesis protein [Bacteroidia bacterium]
MNFKQILNTGYKVAGIALVAYALFYGLTVSLPRMGGLEQSSRNLFYHVPMWFAEVVIMTVSVWYSIKYLRQTDPESNIGGEPMYSDAKAVEAASVGVMLNILGLVTGIIWGRVSWGENINPAKLSAWWLWDPIQTCALIALLIYLGYFLLRASFQEPGQRARISAVLNIFAFAALIPLFFVIPRMLDGLHPTANGGTTELFSKKDVTNHYRMILYPAALGFIFLSLWMWELRSRITVLFIRQEEKQSEADWKRQTAQKA